MENSNDHALCQLGGNGQAHMKFTPLKSSYLEELHLLVLMKKGKVLIMALVVVFSLVVLLFCFFTRVEEALLSDIHLISVINRLLYLPF